MPTWLNYEAHISGLFHGPFSWALSEVLQMTIAIKTSSLIHIFLGESETPSTCREAAHTFGALPMQPEP